MDGMWLLIAAGIGLFWYGNRVRFNAMYPGGQRWPLLATLRSMPKWDQERVMLAVGGAALQFGGAIILLSLTPFA